MLTYKPESPNIFNKQVPVLLSSHKEIALHEGSSTWTPSPPSPTTEDITVKAGQMLVESDGRLFESPHEPFSISSSSGGYSFLSETGGWEAVWGGAPPCGG